MATRCVSVLFLLMVVIPNGWAAEKAGGPRYGGTLRIAVDGTIPAIEPFKGTRFRQFFGFTRYYTEGLVDLDKHANLVPGLAESWEITPDGRVYTFHLRRGVKFHSGDELTAEDVKASFEHAMDKKTGAYYRTNLDLVETIEIPDRYTVRVSLKKASTPFLSNIYGSLIPVVSRKSLLTLDTNPVGTGPFVFEEWEQGLYLRLRRFKDYWKQGRPYVEEVEFRFVPEESVRYTALRAGDVDMADELPPQRMADLKASPQKGFRTIGIPGGGYIILQINTRRHPLGDVRVRQAIAFALDKQEILNATRSGEGEATNQLHPKGAPWYFDVEDRKRDLPAARRLLTEAGLSQGFTVPFMVSPKYLSTAQVMQAQLKPAGIQLEFDQVDDATRLQRESKADFSMDLAGMGYPLDPDRFFLYFYSKTGTRNFSGYNSPEFDRLYEKALVEQDFPKRKQLYTDMTRLIQRDVPEMVILSANRYFGWRDHIKGFEPNLAALTIYSGGGMETTWIEK